MELKDHPAVLAYVAEVSKPGIPNVSTSHCTLRNLYAEFGRAEVDYALEEHWLEQRKAREVPA